MSLVSGQLSVTLNLHTFVSLYSLSYLVFYYSFTICDLLFICWVVHISEILFCYRPTGGWLLCKMKFQGSLLSCATLVTVWQEDSPLPSQSFQEVCCPQREDAWKFWWCTIGKLLCPFYFPLIHFMCYSSDSSFCNLVNQDLLCWDCTHNISTRKRKEIVERAARLRSQEYEWACFRHVL